MVSKSISKDRLVPLDDLRSVKAEIEILTRQSRESFKLDGFVLSMMDLCVGREPYHRLEKHGQFSEI